MRRALAALLAAVLLASPALAGSISNPGTVIFGVPTGTRAGNTTIFGTVSGSLTNGHCVSIDSNSNLVDAGAACGGGTPGGSSTDVQFNNGGVLGGDAGFTYAGNGQATIALGSITTNLKALNITGTWNASGTAFDAPLFMNITNTASSTLSYLADLQIGGSSLFVVRKDGFLSNAISGCLSQAGCVGAGLYPLPASNSYTPFIGLPWMATYDVTNTCCSQAAWIFGGLTLWANDIYLQADNTHPYIGLAANTEVRFSNGNNSAYGGTVDSGLTRNAAGVIEINNGTQTGQSGTLASLILDKLQNGTTYAAAGTALPTCNTAAKGLHAVVSDATSPTYHGTYASGGSVISPVFCNGTNWLTD